MNTVYVDSVAVIGAGGEANCHPRMRWVADAGQGNGSPEQRRATPHIKLVLQVTALHGDLASSDLSMCRPVFAASDCDLQVVDNICFALQKPGLPVSPTQFTNVVHNAAAGHWSLAVKSITPSMSLSARYGSFAAGLMEAISCLEEDGRPVLLVSYQQPGPVRLDKYQPRGQPFAVSMLLQAEKTADTAFSLQARLTDDRHAYSFGAGDLARLHAINPAAKALPLVTAMAAGSDASVVLPLEYGGMAIEMRQCMAPFVRQGALTDDFATA